MRWYSFIVLLIFLNAADSTFWFDDFERPTQKNLHKSEMSQDYLRALSIFKRKLQLLGFYPIVLNDDDGLGYVSVDSFLLDDDDDAFEDRIADLLKKMKKEKKARKKSLKKKLKKSKKTNPTPIVTTTVQPISNIVYYWPSTITTIVHPVEGSIGKQPTYDNESSEENSLETDAISNQKDKNGKQRLNHESSFSFERKLKFDDDDDTTSTTLISSTYATTPYPLITVFGEDLANEEILSQQEIVNKFDEDQEGNISKTTASEEDHFHLSTDSSSSGVIIQDNLTETVTEVYVTAPVPIIYEERARDRKDVIPSLLLDAKNEDNISKEILQSLSTTEFTPTDGTESSTDSSLIIPTGVLEFFHETLPDSDEQYSSIDPQSSSEIVPVPVSNSQEFHISHEVAETSKNNTNIDGHRETGTTDRLDAILQINEETTTIGAIIESLYGNSTPNSSDDKVHTDSVISMPDDHDTDKSDGYEYSIDPKISLPLEITNDFESRSLTNEAAVIVILNDKSGRRSDVVIEADDVNDEDTTDNLPYNLTNENVLEQSNLIENISAEISTPPPTVDASNFDNIEQFDAEIIPLIPIIIKQMRQGNVSPEEMEILKNTFGQFWPFIVEEASRENDSSEEVNPLLSDVLNSVNRRIVKREATVGRWRRPIYGRRIYFDDDDDDFVPRRRYYGLRRRRIIAYY